MYSEVPLAIAARAKGYLRMNVLVKFLWYPYHCRLPPMMSSVAFDSCLSGSPFIIIAALHWAPVIFYALCYMLSMHDLVYSSQQVYEIQVIIIPLLQIKIPRIWGVENLYPRSQGNRRGGVQYLSLCVSSQMRWQVLWQDL